MPKYDLSQPRDLDDYFDHGPVKESEKSKATKKDEISEIEASDSFYASERADEILDEPIFSVNKTEGDKSQSESDLIENQQPGEDKPSSGTARTEEKRQEYKKRSSSSDEADETDYKDVKQETLNYKPIVLGIVIVLVLVVGYFLVDKFLLGASAEETETNKSKISPAEQLRIEQEMRKDSFLKSVNQENKTKLGFISALVDIEQKNVFYSSVYFYDNMLNIELFSRKRDDLALFNRRLKDNQKIKEFEIASVDQRPGSLGGFFALYKIKLAKGESGAVAAALNKQSADTWIRDITQKFGLSVKSQRSLGARSENLFNINRSEFIATGNVKSTKEMIKYLVSTYGNYSIYKLTVIPTNQKNIFNSNYQITLVLDVYL